MSERRYADSEVSAIFRDAATDAQRQVAPLGSPQEGLTLSELQSIGKEVGLTPDAIARAAVALDVQQSGTVQRRLGLPIGVTCTVELPRKLSDDEWDRLVVQLREVFNATGQTRVEGGLRQWWNGNLHVRLEPTATGQRLHLSTVNGQAQLSLRGGLVTLAFSAFFLLTSTSPVLANIPGIVTALIGAGFIVRAAFGLWGWAPLRERQMEAIAASVAAVDVVPRASTHPSE
jgi:hypothetical protein